MDSSSAPVPAGSSGHGFATTHWSLIVSAGKPGGEEAREALSSLCHRYWFPLYAYVRRRVSNLHEAQDLTQEFFLRLLEKDALAKAAPERGRFRSFLLASLDNFLANEWDKARAKKRGGGVQVLPLDLSTGESRLSLEPADTMTPERLYEREWTLTLLGLAMDRLQAECESSGKLRQFTLLKGALAGGGVSYATIAGELEMTEEGARQAAHRLRKRYRELLRVEVAQTVASPSDVDEEIRSLLATLGS
jgi:RNA polymerase sigma-70 factor (ECF subfamily)